MISTTGRLEPSPLRALQAGVAPHAGIVLRFDVAAAAPCRSCAIEPKEERLSLQGRIESLKQRHASLETQIAEEDHRPRPDEDALTRLKLEKLRLKDEMTRLAAET